MFILLCKNCLCQTKYLLNLSGCWQFCEISSVQLMLWKLLACCSLMFVCSMFFLVFCFQWICFDVYVSDSMSKQTVMMWKCQISMFKLPLESSWLTLIFPTLSARGTSKSHFHTPLPCQCSDVFVYFGHPHNHAHLAVHEMDDAYQQHGPWSTSHGAWQPYRFDPPGLKPYRHTTEHAESRIHLALRISGPMVTRSSLVPRTNAPDTYRACDTIWWCAQFQIPTSWCYLSGSHWRSASILEFCAAVFGLFTASPWCFECTTWDHPSCLGC